MKTLLLTVMLVVTAKPNQSHEEEWALARWRPGGVPNHIRPPCPPETYVIDGLCWGKLKEPERPPCPKYAMSQWDGCYLPAVKVATPQT